MVQNEGIANKIKELKGPIVVFGAGGFIGVNLLQTLLRYRQDIIGISQDHINNWRFIANEIPFANLRSCDINDYTQLKEIIDELKPQTIFNLAAYGAYSKQKEYKKIHSTNFNATINLIELLKNYSFNAFIQAGSSSEYGLNAAGPSEKDELVPNSHYAVSKVAAFYAIKYYGKVENLPVAHLRIYSAYGPWEEPDRLMPILIANARKKQYPPLVQPEISRDFIYITDVCSAFINAAVHLNSQLYGEAFNIGTGEKTTIRELVNKVKGICQIQTDPYFGSMDNRNWDVTNWYADSTEANKQFFWKPAIQLETGIQKMIAWQEKVNFDTAFWNWTKKL